MKDDDKEPKVRTVRVDCFKGKSINKALKKHKNDELIIELDGICDEDVLVQRDNVTLRGINLDSEGEPEDGIRAVSTDPDAPPNFGATLFIRDALNVTVENLILTGAALAGLKILDSGSGGPLPIVVRNCRLENNTDVGLALTRANAVFEDTVFTGNGVGPTVMTKSVFGCANCSIVGPLLGGSSILTVIHSTLKGRFQVNSKARITLTNTEQSENPSFNGVFGDSQLNITEGTIVHGRTLFTAFSTGVLGQGTTHDGNLMCVSGSDVVCPRATINGTSNCLQCLPPISLNLSMPEPGPLCGDVSINGGVNQNANIVRIVWIWADGHITEGFFPASHSYSQNGAYTVQVTAHRNDGATETKTTFHTITCF
jgi:hypothetical protein